MESSINIIKELNHGNNNNYLKQKKAVIREFRDNWVNTYSKKEMQNIVSLMLSVEESEIINNSKYISELCVLYNLSMMYKHINSHLKFKFIRIIIYCINKSNGSDMFSYVNKIFNCISTNSDILNRVIEILFNYDRLKEVLFYQYINENFKAMGNAYNLMKDVDFWNDNSSKVIADNYYADKAINKIGKILSISGYDNSDTKKLIQDFNRIFLSDEYKSRILKIYKSTEDALLKAINLDTVTTEEMQKIAENIKYTDGFKVRIIRYSNYALNVLKGEKLEKIFNEFYMVEKSELFYVKKILKRLLYNNINQDNYSLIVFSHTDSDEFCLYEKLIEYLSAFDKTILYDFIKWSLECGIFKNKRTFKVDNLYINALKDYFINNDKEIVKNKEALKKYFVHEESKKLIENIKYEMAGPIKRALFFRAG